MDNKNLVADLTLALLYLTSWKEKDSLGDSVLRSWRSYDWDTLDNLKEEDLIFGSKTAKSIYFTNEGSSRAQELIEQYRLLEGQEKRTKNDDGKNSQAFKFRVELDFEELTCWRQVIVPADYSFLDFHIVLQNCFNWLDYHLFDFRIPADKDKKITELALNARDVIWPVEETRNLPEELDVSDVILADIFPQAKCAIYSYDYGDGWEHKIKFLGVVEDYAGGDEPLCLAGEGDAPPDDVGGEGGFISFLEAIANEDDPQHDFMVDWGESQGFERFDLAETNERLKGWRDHKRAREENMCH